MTPDDFRNLDNCSIFKTGRHITQAGVASCATTIVPPGSIVLSTRAPIGYAAVAKVPLCTNQGCKSLVARRKLDSRYFLYQLLAAKSELESLGQGSTFRELASSKLGSIKVAAPPFDAQLKISAFLDCETAKMDALIAKKERLIELLQEKRAAVVARAVTNGLDRSKPMKNSGVDWLGQMPAHWSIRKVKFLIRGGLVNGLFKRRDDFGSGTRLINVFDIYRDSCLIDENTLDRVEANQAEAEAYAVEPGDIFFVRSS